MDRDVWYFNTMAGYWPVIKTRKDHNGIEVWGGSGFIVQAKYDCGLVTMRYSNDHWEKFKCKEAEKAFDINKYEVMKLYHETYK